MEKEIRQNTLSSKIEQTDNDHDLTMLQQVNQQQQRTNSPHNQKKSFAGSITLFSESCGFVDNEVFFHITVVSDGAPHIGARCMVEAVFNSSMPFHWNATSVQIIPDNNPPSLNQSVPRTRIPQQSGNRWESSTNGDTTRHDQSNNYRNHNHRNRDMEHSRRSPVQHRRDNVHPIRRRSPPPRRASPGKSPMRRPEKRERSPRVSPPRRDRDESRTREESGPPRRRARVLPPYTCNSDRMNSENNYNLQFGQQLGNLQGMINVPNVANLNAVVDTILERIQVHQKKPIIRSLFNFASEMLQKVAFKIFNKMLLDYLSKYVKL